MESESSNLDHSEVKIGLSYTGARYLVVKNVLRLSTHSMLFQVASGYMVIGLKYTPTHINRVPK